MPVRILRLLLVVFLIVVGSAYFLLFRVFPRIVLLKEVEFTMPWNVVPATGITNDKVGVRVFSDQVDQYYAAAKYLRLNQDGSGNNWLRVVYPFGSDTYLVGRGDRVGGALVASRQGAGQWTLDLNVVTYQSFTLEEIRDRLSFLDTVLLEFVLPSEATIAPYRQFEQQCSDNLCRDFYRFALNVEPSRSQIQQGKNFKRIVSPDVRIIIPTRENEAP